MQLKRYLQFFWVSLFVFAGMLLPRTASAQYCNPTYTNGGTGDNITNVSLLTLNNNTAAAGNPSPYYVNYTSQQPSPIAIPTLIAGNTYVITLSFGTDGSQYSGIWIDFDHSNSLDASEFFTAGTNAGGGGTTNISFLVPSTALAGNTRLRVRGGDDSQPANNQACNASNSTWGEAEDYTVNIVIPTPCSGTPVTGTAVANPNPVCPNTSFQLTANGGGINSGIYHIWQSSASATGPWNTITTSTTLNYTVSGGITTTTYYRLKDSCANGGTTAISNVVTVTLNPFYNCYPCVPTYSSGGSADNIASFTFGTLTYNTAALGNPVPYYQNYTVLQPGTLPIPNVIAGTTQNATITFGGDGSQYSGIWVDFDHSSSFGTNEFFTTGTNAGSNGTAVIPIVVPSNALAGITRLRVRGGDDSQPSSNQPCNASNSSWGEAEDYLINIIVSVTATSNSPVCRGGTIAITATSPLPSPTFTFTGPGITTTTNTTGILNVANAAAANSGNFTVSVTSGTTVYPAINVPIVVNAPIPTTAGTVTSPTTCTSANGSIVVNGLNNNAPYVVTFDRNNLPQPSQNLTSNGSGNVTLGGLTAASYSNIVLTSAAGCVTSPLGPLTVLSPTPPASPQATYNAPLCPGSTLVLTVSPTVPNSTYIWTGPNSFAATGAVVTRANMTATDAGNYNVTVTTPDNCVSVETVVSVVVNTPPAAPTVTNPTYCQFDVAQPLTATGTNLRWYTVATGGTASTVAPVPSTLVAGPLLFYVSQINQFGCEGPRALVTVTVKAKPQPPVVNTPTQLCQYEVVGPLTAVGANLKWYPTATSATPLTSAPTPVTNNPGTFNFYVSQTVNGCESDRSQLTVIVKPKPAPPTVQSPFVLCQGDPPAPLPVIGQNLMWYTSQVGGIGSPVNPVPPTGFEDSFTYYVSQTVNGCESDRALLRIFVNYKPNGLIIASKDFVCEGDTISFNYFGNARPDAQFNWKTPNPGTTVISGAGTAGPLVVRYNDSGDSYVRLTVNNKGCLSNELELPVRVRPQARVSIALKPDACVGEQVTLGLSAVTSGVQYYNWNFDGADVKYSVGSAGPYGLVYNTPGTKVIQLFAGRNGCTNFQPFTDTINVHDYPLARIIDRDYGKICAGDRVTLDAEPGYDLVYGAEVPYSFSWQPSAYFGSDSGTQKSSVSAILNKTTPVTLTVTNAWGCSATDSQLVTVGACCDMFFPDAFTPNGDGRNDVFRPITAGNQQVVTFRVLNRWGNVVYETTATGNGWDGNYHGEPQPMNSYYFYIKFQCASGEYVEKQGQFMLIR